MLLFSLGLFATSQGQTPSTIYNGYVKDSLSGEVLIGANVFTGNVGTTTNKYGFFSLSLPTASKRIYVSFVGYKTAQIELNPQKPLLQVLLTPIDLETVVVRNDAPVQQLPIGLTNISIERLKAVPMAFGEVDIMKALAFTPGVSVGNEGTSGLLVRGGTPDQNMILLDDAPLYNQAHLFGFISTFNADAIKKVDLYKGAFPARFGGRLSSVIDVTMKDGNAKQIKKELSIGMLSSRFLIERPLSRRENNKTSFMLSARSSYFTLFLLPTIISYNNGSSEGYFNYWLYDINAKITHRINSTKTLSWSVFRGHDYWYGWDGGQLERSKFKLDWGNTTSTLKYNQILNPKLFLNVMGIFTKYQYKTGFENYVANEGSNELINFFRVSSSVRDWILKTRFEYYPRANWQVYFGSETTVHRYNPSFTQTNFSVNEAVLAQANAAINANEQSFYVENDVQAHAKLRLNAGVRAVLFGVQGQVYRSLEPRLSVNYSPSNQFAIKMSYSQMNQFIHLLSSNTIGFPNDLWVPATQKVRPQFSEQISVGLSKNFADSPWQISVEAYTKSFRDLIDFKTGTDFLTEFDKSWESKIETNGIGKAQGLEVFINKTQGKLSGWVSYAYATNQRKFDNINSGQWFRANFDRRHTAALNVAYQISKRVSISGVWQYSSGQPATVPVAIVRNPEFPQLDLIYRDRNNFQMLDYHRLDLSFNFTKTNKKQRIRTWSWGVINAYNRRNPLFLTANIRTTPNPKGFDFIGIGFNSQLQQVAFFPVLPYVSYSLKIK